MTLWNWAGRGVETYVSPRQRQLTPKEVRVRETAYALKQATPSAINQAVKILQPFVPPQSILIPIPSSKGFFHDTLPLATKLAAITDSRVITGLIRTKPTESTRKRRMRGGGQKTPAEQHMLWVGPDLAGHNVLFIDNVMTSGSTFAAARKAIGTGFGLAYAKADPWESSLSSELIQMLNLLENE